MFLLAISPWHLQFSRPAFEANLALTFYLLALAFFMRCINQYKNLKFGFWNLLFAATAAVAALYSYHSARLVVPLTFLILAIFYHRPLLTRYRQTLLAAGLALILIAPLILIFVRGSAAERFNTVSIFTNPGEFSRERERITRTTDFKASHPNLLSYFHTSKAVYAKIIARNYFEHFNFDFLFLRADGNPRHHASGMGLLYLIEFPFLIYGAYSLTRRRERHKAVVWTILFTGPAASALTASTPHAIRSLLMLPALILLTSYGSTQAINKLGHLEIWSIRNSLLVACSLFLVFMNIFYYLNLYYVVTPYQFSQDWQYGYRQLVTKVGEYQPNYNHVIITTKYDQPYIYFAFYNRLDPDYYQSISQTASDHIGNITFHPITESDFDSPNALIAADQATTPANAHILDQIYFLNGQVAFNLISTN